MPTHIYNPGSEDVVSEILDLGHLCHSSEDIEKVLHMLVGKIARIMEADVCSLYLEDPQTKEYILKATLGLNADAIGKVRMKVGEGLVGKTVEWLKPVSMSRADRSRQFKYFPETGEDKFASFLSVPLIYNRHAIGVLVVQNRAPERYSARTAHLLMSLAIPAVNVIEKAKLLGSFDQVKRRAKNEALQIELTGKREETMTFQALGASPGIAIARICILKKSIHQNHLIHQPVGPIHAEVEKMRVLEAFRWVEEEIRSIQTKAQKKFGMEELSIFDAYKMVLESDIFKDQILAEIDSGKSALKSVETVISRYTEELTQAEDEYIRERVFDIQDMGRKITDRLLYGSQVPDDVTSYSEGNILISEFWSISDMVDIDLEKTKGILSPSGGASSHVAILAKSLGLPAIMGLSSFTDRIREGDTVIMDGTSGVVIVNPLPDIRKIYEKEQKGADLAKKRFREYTKKKATPKRGNRIPIGANMGMVAHAKQALDQGAENIGLYRTEFPFLIRRSIPTEEEQFMLYKKVLQGMGKRPVTIRTLDIGGDKYLPYLNLPKEDNPSLGWRSIRISLEREDLFRIQLRALLRSSVFGKLRILFPMICSVEEIRRVKEIMEDVKKELKAENHKIASQIPYGIMIEVPSAVEIAEALIQEVHFFSIGSNDLIQYTLAVDRNNAKVAKIFEPLHPAVLRQISRVIKAAHKYKKTVTLCGEMASHPLCVPLMIGMKIDALSMSAPVISKIKNLICLLDAFELNKLVSKVLKLNTSSEIKNEVTHYFSQKDLLSFIPQETPLAK